MRKKLLFLMITAIVFCAFAITVSAANYTPAFGTPVELEGISEPTVLDENSRVLMSDGITYPAYYILKDSATFSPDFNKINKIVGANTYSRATVVAIELPEGITNMPSCYNAGGFFQGDKFDEIIEYLRMPSTLETMGDAAIFSMASLKIIDNLENTKLVEIPTRGFNGLTSLQYIHLPNTVKKIPDRAFRDCNSLEYINLGASIEYIGTQAFLYAGKDSAADSLKIYISGSITEIYNGYGDGVLQGCKSVVELYYTGDMDDSGMAQIIANPGILKNASKWQTVDASATGFDKNATYTTSTIIYNYNICDAFYGGNHIIKDVNGCQFACDNCGNTLIKENPQHENSLNINKTVAGYFGKITAIIACKNCGEVSQTEEIAEMFVSLGYSACLYDDSHSITQGFKVDKVAIAAYKKYVSDFEFGVIVTVNMAGEGENAQDITPGLNDENVYVHQFKTLVHDYVDVKVTGIPKDANNAYIVLCMYAREGSTLCYLDDGITKSSILGVSFKNIKNSR